MAFWVTAKQPTNTTHMEKLSIIKDVIDCNGGAFLVAVDEHGFVHLTVDAEYNKNNPESDVASFLYNQLCKVQLDALNWRSHQLAVQRGEIE